METYNEWVAMCNARGLPSALAERYTAQALVRHGSEAVAIDAFPEMSYVGPEDDEETGGCWVQGWLWVRTNELPPETPDA